MTCQNQTINFSGRLWLADLAGWSKRARLPYRSINAHKIALENQALSGIILQFLYVKFLFGCFSLWISVYVFAHHFVGFQCCMCTPSLISRIYMLVFTCQRTRWQKSVHVELNKRELHYHVVEPVKDMAWARQKSLPNELRRKAWHATV